MQLLPMVALISTVTLGSPPSKCRSTVAMPGYEKDEPVILVDGRIVRGSGAPALADLDPEDVHAVEVTCWRPDRGAFGTGPGPAVSVVRVITKSLVSGTRAPLEALVRAQEAYGAEHGEHARTLGDLYADDLVRPVEVDFSASDGGWYASTPEDAVAYRCTASFETAGAESEVVQRGRGTGQNASGAVGVPGHARIDCERQDTLELRALRERFESGVRRPG